MASDSSLASVLYPSLGVWGGVDGAEISVEVLEVACLAHHSSIVGGVGERWDIHRPAMTTTKVDQRIA